MTQPSDSEGNPWDGDSPNDAYDYLDHIQLMSPADEEERHMEEEMFEEESQFWKELIEDAEQ